MEEDKISNSSEVPGSNKYYHIAVRRPDGSIIDPIADRESANLAANSKPDESLAGMVPVPFPRALLHMGQDEIWVEQRTELPLAPPYRLAIEPADCVYIKEIRLGNVSLLAAPEGVFGTFLCTPTYPDYGGMQTRILGPLERMMPLSGPPVSAGTVLRVLVVNSSCATIELGMTLFGKQPVAERSAPERSSEQPGRRRLPGALTMDELRDRELARTLEARADDLVRKENLDRLRPLRDRLASMKHEHAQKRPIDADDDAAWESPNDEWP
jgi:hypothetical protein